MKLNNTQSSQSSHNPLKKGQRLKEALEQSRYTMANQYMKEGNYLFQVKIRTYAYYEAHSTCRSKTRDNSRTKDQKGERRRVFKQSYVPHEGVIGLRKDLGISQRCAWKRHTADARRRCDHGQLRGSEGTQRKVNHRKWQKRGKKGQVKRQQRDDRLEPHSVENYVKRKWSQDSKQKTDCQTG